MTMEGNKKQRTVRELGGEIWAEISMEQDANPDSKIAEIHFESVEELTEIIMAVLARHAGEVIVNDKDRPVTPLSHKFESDV